MSAASPAPLGPSIRFRCGGREWLAVQWPNMAEGAPYFWQVTAADKTLGLPKHDEWRRACRKLDGGSRRPAA